MLTLFAHVAQLVEHFLGKGEVTGSSPVAGSIIMLFVNKNLNNQLPFLGLRHGKK